MRPETDIISDINSLSTEVDNMRTVAPPLLGPSADLQERERNLINLLKELVKSRGGGLAEPEPATAPPPPSFAAAPAHQPAGKPPWKKK